MQEKQVKVRVCRYGNKFYKVGHIKTKKAVQKIAGHKPDEIGMALFSKEEEKRMPHVIDVFVPKVIEVGENFILNLEVL